MKRKKKRKKREGKEAHPLFNTKPTSTLSVYVDESSLCWSQRSWNPAKDSGCFMRFQAICTSGWTAPPGAECPSQGCWCPSQCCLTGPHGLKPHSEAVNVLEHVGDIQGHPCATPKQGEQRGDIQPNWFLQLRSGAQSMCFPPIVLCFQKNKARHHDTSGSTIALPAERKVKRKEGKKGENLEHHRHVSCFCEFPWFGISMGFGLCVSVFLSVWVQAAATWSNAHTQNSPENPNPCSVHKSTYSLCKTHLRVGYQQPYMHTKYQQLMLVENTARKAGGHKGLWGRFPLHCTAVGDRDPECSRWQHALWQYPNEKACPHLCGV